MTERTIIRNAHTVTVTAADDEFGDGYLVIDDAVIVAVGAGAAPSEWTETGAHAGTAPRITVVDARGHLVTPGLINTAQ
ncbi:hypothetical protein B7R22_12765 [Subtercola boreus]|uniref:Uncharacterized protein n=1 Tax=Subtercola boreus TaxID=120213 RepID=A0A3E0VU29_9MICO|nr:hypothetical protein [Subtercola boreus]RFA13532.1 hypothetical protein B7R22_12765 [Subtercola boreus]